MARGAAVIRPRPGGDLKIEQQSNLVREIQVQRLRGDAWRRLAAGVSDRVWTLAEIAELAN